MTIATQASQAALISGLRVPDSTLANEITKFIRGTESTLLRNPSAASTTFSSDAVILRGMRMRA
jgi:hypothetical protein